jgi:hypothetical protein
MSLIINILTGFLSEKQGFYGEFLPSYGELKLFVFRIALVF